MSEHKKGVAVADPRAHGSSDVQDTLVLQQAACEARANMLGPTFQGVCADDAGGERVADHGGFEAMMDAARVGDFAVLLIESQDRPPSVGAELVRLLDQLRALGVEVHEVGHGKLFSRSAFEVFLWRKREREAMGRRIRIGQEMAARRGLIPSSCCFGYATVPGKPGHRVIVPEQAKTVREIFGMRSDGATRARIAAVLNARPDGAARTWTPAGVGRLLRNPLYAGTLVHGRRTVLRDASTGRVHPVERLRKDWTVVPVEHLRIVPQETWDAVQASLKSR